MIKTVIIDDEPRNIKLIDSLIRDYCPSLKVVGSADNLTNVIPLIKELEPSLLLLDIEFPTGTIFPILEKLPAGNFQVIFITAYNTYAAEAFRQNAVDYVLKPVTKHSLVNAVKKAEARLNDKKSTDISRLIEILKPALGQSRKIPLSSSDTILFVDENDIIRCEASGRYSIVHLADKRKVTVTKTLKEMEALLDSPQFFRVHNSHIIHLDRVSKYHKGPGGMVELKDGSMIEVGASRKDELLDILLNKRSA